MFGLARFRLKAFPEYESPVPAVVVAELNLFQSLIDKQPKVEVLAVAQVKMLGVVPMTEIGLESERAPLAVKVVVATEPSFAGEPFVVVQYESCPAVSEEEVEIEPVALIVTAPVLPEIETFEPATIDVTPEFVRTPELFESPAPSKLLND